MSIYDEMGISPIKPRTLTRELVYNLARTYIILNKLMSKFFVDFGLTPAKLNILLALRLAGGERGLPQNEIGNKLVVSASNMTGLIDRLEKEGLASRVDDPNDRRVKLIKITKKGSELLDKVWKPYTQKLEEVTSVLSEEEKTDTIKILTKWRKGV